MSKGIPHEIIEEIQEKNDIVSIVEQYVNLEKKSAQNLFGLCPFHSEKTPSFSVSPQKQIYYCFGCHKGGNVINFLMEIEKMGYLDAIKMLAEKVNVELPESNDKEYQRKAIISKTLFEVNTQAARYFYKNLAGNVGSKARQYLNQRGIDVKTIKKFGLGYAKDEWDGLLKHLRSLGFDEDIIYRTGLFKKRESGGMYDIMRNRLIFPIFDYLGRVVAFGGRVLDDSMPKYINSPETEIYIKGKHLYGYHLAKSSKEDRIIVVEGYLDAISIHQAGFDNAVASLGTALTPYQATLLRKHSQNVVIAYDSDLAGLAATMRGMDILNEKDCKVFVLTLPEGKDPDEYIKKNSPEQFKALIKSALPFMDYKLKIAYEKSLNDGVLDTIKYQELACDILVKEENKIVRELYAEKVASNLKTSTHTVLDEITRQSQNMNINKKEYKIHSENYSNEEKDFSLQKSFDATKEELYLLCLLATNAEVKKSIDFTIDTKYFTSGIMQMIAKTALDEFKKDKLDPSSLVEIGGDNLVNKRKLSELFASGCMKTENINSNEQANKELLRFYNKMKIYYFSNKKNELMNQLSEEGISKEEKDKIKSEILKISVEVNTLRN